MFKRYLNLILKFLLAILIIWLMRDKFNLSQFYTIISNPSLFLIALISWGLNQFLVSIRLNNIMQALGIASNFKSILNANMSSLFAGNLLPGVIGSDLIKYFYLKKKEKNLSDQLVLALTIDRVLGLFTIVLYSLFFSVFLLIDMASSKINLGILWLVSAPWLICIFSILLFFLTKIFIKAYKPSSNKFYSFKNALDFAVSKGSRKFLLLAIINSFFAVFSLMAGLAWIGGELHAFSTGNQMFFLQLLLIPLVLISAILPFTPMGVGIAQFTMASAYSLCGLDESVGVTVSSISQLSLLLLSLVIGGYFFIFFKMKGAEIDKS